MTDLETIKAMLEKADIEHEANIWVKMDSTPEDHLSWTDCDITIRQGDRVIEFEFSAKDHSLTDIFHYDES